MWVAIPKIKIICHGTQIWVSLLSSLHRANIQEDMVNVFIVIVDESLSVAFVNERGNDQNGVSREASKRGITRSTYLISGLPFCRKQQKETQSWFPVYRRTMDEMYGWLLVEFC